MISAEADSSCSAMWQCAAAGNMAKGVHNMAEGAHVIWHIDDEGAIINTGC